MARFLIMLGIILVLLGAFWSFGERFGLGHLPGDITLKGERYSIHFPIMTCILLSVAASVIFWIINYLRR